jgi:uncharacterized protein
VTVYVDSSVVLRVVLGQPNALAEWSSISAAVSSRLIEVECVRTVDRLRLRRPDLATEDLVARRAAVYRVIEALQIVDVSPLVLSRAAQPMSAPLGTLDAIHLATAQLWRETRGESLTIATHDRALALAAIGDGFHVVGS